MSCIITTLSGRKLDLLDPQPDQFTFEDIASGLSKACRFAGQVSQFYSVAEHCLHCAGVAANDGRSMFVVHAALMHDAAEAFIGDMSAPLKELFPQYRQIEDSLLKVIGNKYGINFAEHWPTVQEIDLSVRFAEKRLFMPTAETWHGEAEARKLTLDRWEGDTEKTKQVFLRAAEFLGLDVSR